MQKACLCFAPYGNCQSLTQQIIDRALLEWLPDAEKIRRQTDYEQRLVEVKNSLDRNRTAISQTGYRDTDAASKHCQAD